MYSSILNTLNKHEYNLCWYCFVSGQHATHYLENDETSVAMLQYSSDTVNTMISSS